MNNEKDLNRIDIAKINNPLLVNNSDEEVLNYIYNTYYKDKINRDLFVSKMNEKIKNLCVTQATRFVSLLFYKHKNLYKQERKRKNGGVWLKAYGEKQYRERARRK